ncbi:glycosyltransferase [Roseovarius sp. S1116L3]|uniref:glycosyltransferase n=1 Tax=Roseovarius roseus TaxID=3342636 RepID=UPI00372A9AF6
MIFLTIGTHEPFDRLAKAVDEWASQASRDHEIIAQVISPPTDAYVPEHFDMIAHMSPAQYENQIKRSDLIVSHAGMGTILTAFTHGKPIVIMPRRGHLNETRNDHQYTTIKSIPRRPGLFVAEDEDQFSDVMNRAVESVANTPLQRLSAVADTEFTDGLRSFLLGSAKA